MTDVLLALSIQLQHFTLLWQLSNKLHGAKSFFRSHSTSQEIPCLLWNPKVHYYVHKTLPMNPALWVKLSQSTASHTISLRSILILTSNLHLGLRSHSFPFDFLTKIWYVFFISPMHPTCPDHLILLVMPKTLKV
jgi:hypothetical protein